MTTRSRGMLTSNKRRAAALKSIIVDDDREILIERLDPCVGGGQDFLHDRGPRIY